MAMAVANKVGQAWRRPWPLQSPRSSRYPRLHSSSLSLQANGSGETPALTMSTPVAEPDGGYDWRVRLSTQVVGDSS